MPIPTCARLRRFAPFEKKIDRLESPRRVCGSSGKHRDLQTWTASAARARARKRARGQDNAAGGVEPDGRLAARLGMKRIFYLNLGDRFLSPVDLPGTAVAAREKSRRLHPRFDEWHFAEHGRQARGALNLSEYPILRPRDQRRDVPKYMMRGSFE